MATNNQMFYHVVRFRACRKRGEVINIGLVAFYQNEFKVKTSDDLRKIQMFDDSVDMDMLDDLNDGLESWAHEFNGNYPEMVKTEHIFLSGKGWVLTKDNAEFDQNFNNIYHELVG